MFHVKASANLMVEIVFKSKNVTMISVNVNSKSN